MKIDYHKDFLKSFKKQHQKIKDKFKERQIFFEINKFDPVLNNHALQGKWQGFRSINVTGDIRAVFKESGDLVIFVAIDSHSNLYS